MTNEEAFDLLYRKVCRCENESRDACDMCTKAYKMLEMCALKADRYRWHDLRKNPDDLPEIGKTVLCFCLGNWYRSIKNTGYPNSTRYFNLFVIAWREFEPFEEELHDT